MGSSITLGHAVSCGIVLRTRTCSEHVATAYTYMHRNTYVVPYSHMHAQRSVVFAARQSRADCVRAWAIFMKYLRDSRTEGRPSSIPGGRTRAAHIS